VSLIKTLEVKVLSHYDNLTLTLKARLSRVYAEKLFSAVRELSDFRRSLSLEPNAEIDQLAEGLRLQSMDTEDVVSQHLSEVADAMEGRGGPAAFRPTLADALVNVAPRQAKEKVAIVQQMGQLVFSAGQLQSDDDDLLVAVVLRSLSEVLPREGKNEAFPQVVARLLPLKGDEFILKTETAVYDKCSDVFFDLVDLDHHGEEDAAKEEEDGHLASTMDGHKLLFRCPKQGCTSSLLLALELFDHSSVRTHKVFRGLTLVRVADLPTFPSLEALESDGDRSVASLRALPTTATSTPSFKELGNRKADLAAIDYVERIRRQVAGIRIPHISTHLKSNHGGLRKRDRLKQALGFNA